MTLKKMNHKLNCNTQNKSSDLVDGPYSCSYKVKIQDYPSLVVCTLPVAITLFPTTLPRNTISKTEEQLIAGHLFDEIHTYILTCYM